MSQHHGHHGHHHGHRFDSPLRFAVLTFSDTRTEETDSSGKAIIDLLVEAGHSVILRAVVREDSNLIQAAINDALAEPRVQALVTTGGTGISLRDLAYESVSAVLFKTLEGFGELFRMLSYQEVGSSAMASRAVGGVTKAGHLVFSLPGSTKAVTLGMTKLILPEVSHLYGELHK